MSRFRRRTHRRQSLLASPIRLHVELLEPRRVLSATLGGGGYEPWAMHAHDHQAGDALSAPSGQFHGGGPHGEHLGLHGGRPAEHGAAAPLQLSRPDLPLSAGTVNDPDSHSPATVVVLAPADPLPHARPLNDLGPRGAEAEPPEYVSFTVYVVWIVPLSTTQRSGSAHGEGEWSFEPPSGSAVAPPASSDVWQTPSAAASDQDGTRLESAASALFPAQFAGASAWDATAEPLSGSITASTWLAASFNTAAPDSRLALASAAHSRLSALSADRVIDRATPHTNSLRVDGEEGGLIEIDVNADSGRNQRVESADDIEDTEIERHEAGQAERDEMWLDLEDLRLDWLLDSEDRASADQAASDPDATTDAMANKERWLLDEGGMIALATSELEQAPSEPAADDAARPATQPPLADQLEIPMDADLGVYQAVDVAATPISPDGQAATDGEAPPAAADQAAHQASSDEQAGEPARGAVSPFWLAALGLLRRRKNRGTTQA